jgi:tRNA pseudouridine38-40 synthase
MQERYAWRVWPKPELDTLRTCAQSLLGRHDFRAFGQAPIPGGHTRREVFKADWVEIEDTLELMIAADAFLHRMVRRMIGAMVEAASGRIGLQDLLALRDDPKNRWQGTLAPARGLCLEAVWYRDEYSQRLMKDKSPERESLRLGRKG